PTADQQREDQRALREIARLRNKLRESTLELVAGQRAWEKELSPRSEHPWKPISNKAAIADERLRLNASAPEGTTAVRFSLDQAPAAAWTLSDIRLEAAKSNQAEKPLVGRIVRIDLPGKNKMIHLAEVEVISAGVNVARKGTARQSSTYSDAEAKRAIDGN